MRTISKDLRAESSLFYGERGCRGQLPLDKLHSWFGHNSVCVTEDGSGAGQQGLVTEPLIAGLKKERRPIIACGPPAMLAAVAKIARSFETSYYACLEARMACGLGVCLSCSLPAISGGNIRVCQEGPVFNGLDIDWERVSG